MIVVRYDKPLPALAETGPMSQAPRQPSELELKLVDGLDRGRLALPVLPEAAAEAIDLANQPDASIQDFVGLIQRDPTIAARFISTANSAYYSRGRAVTRLDQAIMRVGLMSSRDLLFQIVYGNTTQGLKRYKKQVAASFARSVLAAVTARIVSGTLEEDFRDAYLCGLLHDIGEARVYRILDRLVKRGQEPGEVPALVERYHARAGAEIAREWKLPEEIVEVCEQHHDPVAARRDHVRLVQIADLVVAAAQSSDPEVPPMTLAQLAERCVEAEVATGLVNRARAAAGQL